MSIKSLLKIVIAITSLIGYANLQLACAQETTVASQPGEQVATAQISTEQGASGISAQGSTATRFSKVQLGMTIKQVNLLIGPPDDSDSHESGKRWIPFYFGNDARRLEALYKNEGCLVFASGNAWGANAEGELKEITPDPSGACFKQ
jgi:hypothetical protein